MSVPKFSLNNPMEMLSSGLFWGAFIDEVTLHSEYVLDDEVGARSIPAKTVVCMAVVVRPENMRPFLEAVHGEHDQAVRDWSVSGLHFGDMMNRKRPGSEFKHLTDSSDEARIGQRVFGVSRAIEEHADVVLQLSADPSSVEAWRGRSIWKNISEPFRHLPGDYAKWGVLCLLNQYIADNRAEDHQVGVVLMDRFDNNTGHFIPSTRMSAQSTNGQQRLFTAFAGGTVYFVDKMAPALAAADLACYAYARRLHDVAQGKVEPRFRKIHESAELIDPLRWSPSQVLGLIQYADGKRGKQTIQRLGSVAMPTFLDKDGESGLDREQ